MLMTVTILLLIMLVSWFAIDLGVGKKVCSQKEYTFPHRKASLSIFTNGNELYEDLFSEIRRATRYVHISFYIVKDDRFSHDFFDLLIEKAKSGIEVRLLVDRIGSIRMTKKARRTLQQAGVHFSFSRRPRWPYFFYTLNARNHRKIAIIDGAIGYLGGFNIGQEYLGLDPKLGIWKDYHLKLLGDVIADLQFQFLSDWQLATAENLMDDSHYFQVSSHGNQPIQLRSTEGALLEHHFLSLINEAKQELCIGTPYFIPSEPLMHALLEARKRGVTVNIVIPMRADHPLVRDAAFAYFPTLLQAGCNIYQYYYGFYHAKVLIADEIICDVGTGNFDKRSLFLNGEINYFIFDSAFIKQVKETFYSCLRDSPKLSLSDLSKRTWIDRFKQSFATFFSPLL
ncbi:cardiolipin synthase [Priestia megaterium]|nr:cardiolipin synthase [Priestia megaterium]